MRIGWCVTIVAGRNVIRQLEHSLDEREPNDRLVVALSAGQCFRAEKEKRNIGHCSNGHLHVNNIAIRARVAGRSGSIFIFEMLDVAISSEFER